MIDRDELDPSVAKSPDDLPTDMLLAALPRVAATGHQVERDLKRTPRQLRERDVAWEVIAEVLGLDTTELAERFPDLA